MAADEALGQAELAAQGADLVLEELAQRLDELQVHPLGEAADVVVALDRDRRAAGEADALDHVGIERALGEELRVADLLRVLLEDLDEQAADGLALRPRGPRRLRGRRGSGRPRRRGSAGCCSGRGRG